MSVPRPDLFDLANAIFGLPPETRPIGEHGPSSDLIIWDDLPQKKVSKSSVHYRLATGSRRCGNCAMLHGQVCDLVLGRIDRMYLCDKWVKK